VGYKEVTTTRILPDDVVDPYSLIARLVEEGQKDQPSPERRIWERLDEPLQKQLVAVVEPVDEDESVDPMLLLAQVFQARDSLVEELNEIIEQRDLYDETAWADVDMDEEAAALHKQGLEELSDDESARFNRLMLESGFRGLLRTSPPTSLILSYFIWDTGEPVPLSRAQLADAVHGVLPFVLDKGLLSIGLLVGILVTAPIIPQTLEAGSISLLLSKPVSRTLLFLSKFVGGCAFMVLLSTFLIGGLWFILGLRLGLWSKELLLAIPLYVFVFGVYYSVSAAAAVRWRNTIMAIVAAIVFWAACFTVGWVKFFWENTLDTRRIVNVVPAGDTVAFSDIRGQSYVWNGDAGSWEEAFMTPEKRNQPAFARMLAFTPSRGLSYDARNELLLCVRFTGSLGEALVGSAISGDYAEKQIGEAPLASAEFYTDASGDLVVLSRLGYLVRIDSEQVKRALESPGPQPGIAVPPGAQKATRTKGTDSTDGRSTNRDGAFSPEENGEDVDASDNTDNSSSCTQVAEPADEASDDSSESNAAVTPVADGAELELYDLLGPEPLLRLRDPWAAAMNPDSGELAVYSRGTLAILAPNPDKEGIYEYRETAEIDGIEPETSVVLGFSGDSLLAGRPDGALLLIDRTALTVRDTFEPEKRGRPLVVASAPKGRWFAVVFSNRKLWLVDARDGKVFRPRVSGQGDISTVVFSGANELLVADRTTRVSRYQVDPLELEERMVGDLSLGERAYRYVILPVYTVFPKPGETYKTIQHLLTRRDTADGDAKADSAAQVEILHPWAPVWSGLIFMIVVLALTCVYIERQEY
jgi:hypothetical protein